jgi:hypothetical protein
LDNEKRNLLDKNSLNKRARLDNGFYGSWQSGWHEDYLSTQFPDNFSYVAHDPDEPVAHGHHGSGLYVVTQPGDGFAKNGFIEDTGMEAFCVTLPKMRELAHMLGTTAEERMRIELGFYDDTLHVGAGIVVPEFPVFAEGS